ncbi:MAG: hypothetical protein ACRDYY_03615, partial [Acidimicrobiales bacterium]
MSVTETTSAQIEIEVGGAPLDPLVYQRIVSAEIDTSMYVPSQFRLVFRGYPNEILEPGGFQLAVPVTLQVTTGGVPKQLLMGEVTAVEIDGAPDGILTVVKGMDRSNRLMRGTKTMAYPDQVASDVVTTLIGEASIDPGEIVPTTTVYEWLTQANISSWVFIQQLAALEN